MDSTGDSGDGSGPKRHPGIANLKPFPKGVSGNPKGGPKGAEGFAKKIRKLTGNGKLLLQFAMDVATESGGKDRMRAIEFLADRMLGKAPQVIEMSGPDGGAIQTQTTPGAAHEPDPARIAAILEVLRRVGAIPGPDGLEALGAPDGAQKDPVDGGPDAHAAADRIPDSG